MIKTINLFKIAAMLVVAISYIFIVDAQLDQENSSIRDYIYGSHVPSNISICVPSNDSTYDPIIMSNMESHKNLTYVFPKEPSYVLRLDDVQTPKFSDISMRIINDTLSINMSITIAVIPNRTQNDTTGIIEYINTQKDNPHLEIAQHGYVHTYCEYNNSSISDVQTNTICGLRCLYYEFNTTPVVFVPPNNAIYSSNNTTANVLNDMGFKIISADGDLRYEGNTLNTGCHVATNGIRQHNNTEIMDACKKDFEDQNFSVIMIHPQDFVGEDNETLDPEKYATYLELLDELNNTGAQSITFKDLLR